MRIDLLEYALFDDDVRIVERTMKELDTLLYAAQTENLFVISLQARDYR